MTMKNWKVRLLAAVALAAIPIALGTIRVCADEYEYVPYTPPTIDGIYHECVATLPPLQTRLTIGIGEHVNVWISPDSWTDKDCRVVPKPTKIVEDEIGSMVYTLSEEFNALAGIKTGDAASILITAALLSEDGTGTVNWIVYDSGTHPGAEESISLDELMFSILVPKGMMTPFRVSPMLLGIESTVGPDMGCLARFYMQVTPLNVNFKWIDIRENIPTQQFTWPCGSVEICSAEVIPGSVFDYYDMAGNTAWNAVEDLCGIYYRPTWKLLTSGGPIDCNPVIWAPLEFQIQSGDWQTFETEDIHTHYFRGSDFKARVEVLGTSDPWRGPFHAIWYE